MSYVNCRRCGAENAAPATGIGRGLCGPCFEARVDQATGMIQNQRAFGPVPAMLVCITGGASEERREEFAAGERPTGAEVDAAFAALEWCLPNWVRLGVEFPCTPYDPSADTEEVIGPEDFPAAN